MVLDNLTLMNATYAKSVFTDRTISEILRYLSVHLNVKVEWKLKHPSEWHKYMHECIRLSDAMNNNTSTHLRSNLELLKFQVCVHGVFIERLLNRNWKVSRANIDLETDTLTKILDYFSKWKTNNVSKEGEEPVSARIRESFFISTKTYRNMLTLVRGFMAYAKSVLESSPEIMYVPGLHSNQSSIEGLFSNIRSMSKDRTDLYASGILQQNIFRLHNEFIKIKGNASY